MQTPEETRRDLPPDLDEFEREELVALAMRLQTQSPVPDPSFRSDLRELLGLNRSRFGSPLPTRPIRMLAVSYVASGLLLLAIAAVGLTGSGPFASG